jgi:hypothetical protein
LIVYFANGEHVNNETGVAISFQGGLWKERRESARGCGVWNVFNGI